MKWAFHKSLKSILSSAAIWCICMGIWRGYKGTFDGLTTVLALIISGILLGMTLQGVSFVIGKWVLKNYSSKGN
jgi:hypothetical protein